MADRQENNEEPMPHWLWTALGIAVVVVLFVSGAVFPLIMIAVIYLMIKLYWGLAKSLVESYKEYTSPTEKRRRQRQGEARAKQADELARRVNLRRHGERFSSYEEYMKSSQWRSVRDVTMRYLGCICEFCGRSALTVHHVEYPKTGHLGKERISCLTVVCRRCHEVAHGLHQKTGSQMCDFCGDRAIDRLRARYPMGAHPTSISACKKCKWLMLGYREYAGFPERGINSEWAATWENELDEVLKTL